MVVVTSLSRFKEDNETEIQFVNRLCSLKDELNLTWKEIAEICKDQLGYYYSESWYRKNYKRGAFAPVINATLTTSASSYQEAQDSSVDTEIDVCEKDDISEDTYTEDMNKLLMKRAELCDLVTSNNAMIRRMSREQTIIDIAHDFAEVMKVSKPCLSLSPVDNEYSGIEGVLLISDWHYGLVCDNYWNKFNPEICTERISALLSKVKESIRKNRVQKLTVLDLSDLIAGRIHSQIRIESRFDVITQTMKVSEILAEFLNELSIYCPVDFYSCLDNHSRLEPNKKESMDLESLTRIIPWYLKERLEQNHRINIQGNSISEDIITCNVLGHNIVAVHGHDDTPSNALEKLSMMTHKHYDLMCMAHRHHMFLEEQFESVVISNGCLVGVDSYAQKARLTSKPSQTLILVTRENVIDSIKRILV